jgi:arginine deiminase
MKKTNPVCVYSEIGQIKEVIVHRPGPELGHFEPSDTNANLFDEIINWQQASKEHDKMVKIIKENGGKVIYYTDLIIDTYNKVDKEKKTIFKDKFVDEIVNISHDKKLDGKPIDSKIKKLVREYLDTLEVKDMVFKMIEGITTEMLGLEKRYGNYIVPAMPNLYFMRDTFSMVGNAINIHHMKYKVRDRESLFA